MKASFRERLYLVFSQPDVHLLLDGCDKLLSFGVEFVDGLESVVEHVIVIAGKPLFEECRISYLYSVIDYVQAEWCHPRLPL